MRAQNGSIRKRPNGTWEYRASIQGKRVSFYGRTRNETLKKYKEYEAEYVPPKEMSVERWARVWLDVYKKPVVSYTTLKNYKMYTENHIIPVIGEMKLTEVKKSDIKTLLADKRNLSYSAQKHIYLCLRSIFESALDDDLIAKNPVPKTKIGNVKQDAPQHFTAEQVQDIMSAAKDDPFGHIVLLLLYTGLRIGELCALKWTDIEGDKITIRRAVATEESGTAEKAPKSGKERVLYQTEDLSALLAELPKDNEYVINSQGNRYRPDSLSRNYKKFFERHNLPYLSPHKCRHTYATFLVESGANLLYVKELLGHSTVRVTEIYAHTNDEPLQRTSRLLKYPSKNA